MKQLSHPLLRDASSLAVTTSRDVGGTEGQAGQKGEGPE